MTIPLNGFKKYEQGVFIPVHKEKYKGNTPILFRSSYEKRFMKWCDCNPTITKWSSESIIIPYYDTVQQKQRRYFVDFCVEFTQNNSKQLYLIEIKPSSQTTPPQNKKHKHKKTLLREQVMYVNNQDKWNAAKEWCRKRNMKFLVVTEKELCLK